jgi:hypothetical protein
MRLRHSHEKPLHDTKHLGCLGPLLLFNLQNPSDKLEKDKQHFTIVLGQVQHTNAE